MVLIVFKVIIQRGMKKGKFMMRSNKRDGHNVFFIQLELILLYEIHCLSNYSIIHRMVNLLPKLKKKNIKSVDQLSKLTARYTFL